MSANSNKINENYIETSASYKKVKLHQGEWQLYYHEWKLKRAVQPILKRVQTRITETKLVYKKYIHFTVLSIWACTGDKRKKYP